MSLVFIKISVSSSSGSFKICSTQMINAITRILQIAVEKQQLIYTYMQIYTVYTIFSLKQPLVFQL